MRVFLKRWILPPGYIQLFQRKEVVAPVMPKEVLVDTSFNAKFKDIHKGDRCFILASGPSIASQNLIKLKDEYCIAVSHFHLHKDIQLIKPSYHVLAPQHPPFNFSDSSKYFDDFLLAYKDLDIKYFLGVNDYEFNYINLIKGNLSYSNLNVHFLNYEKGVVLDENNYNDEKVWDISNSDIFSMRTVVYGAIQVAIYMGFNRIYLLGCDHDYLNDIARTTNHHFYKEDKGISDKLHLSEFTRERWFLEYYMRWKQYRLMNEYAKTRNIEIINATAGGMLDVFPRVNLDEIV